MQSTLLVDVLDVGQGDAILLRSSEGKVVLIDGGTGAEPLISELKARKLSRIDLMIATHPHSDHIGGLDDVFEEYRVGMFIDSGDTHTSRAYERLMDAVESEGARYMTAASGKSFNLGEDVKIELLGPPTPRLEEGDSRSHLNANSVIARVTHGNNCFLFTGDAEDETEERLLREQIAPCAVLKVAHHGSSHSTSQAWLDAVQPTTALISVGEGNSYGHPTDETLGRLKAAGAAIYRTDIHGTIQLESNGASVSVRTGGETANTPPRTVPRVVGGDKVDINSASADALDALPGIGPKYAQAIVDHRRAHGPFASCDDLTKISGIGAKTVDKVRPRCTAR